MTTSDTKAITAQVLAKIHTYEQPAARRARARRKALGTCVLAAAALLCAFTATALAQRFSPALPPADSAAQQVLQNSGTPLAQSVTCGGVRFTVDGAVWDATTVYLWLTADAAPQALTDFRFVVQPWSGPLAPAPTKAQNCAVVFFAQQQTPAAQDGDMQSQFVLQYALTDKDREKDTLNLGIRAATGETAHTALRLALNAPREKAVYEMTPFSLRVGERTAEAPAAEAAPSTPELGGVQEIVCTKITVQPFGAVLEATGLPGAVLAVMQGPAFSVRLAPAQSAGAASAPVTLPADACAGYENGTIKIYLRWSATVTPESVTALVCGDAVIELPAQGE